MFGLGHSITTHRTITKLIEKGVDEAQIIKVLGITEDYYRDSVRLYDQFLEQRQRPSEIEPEVSREARKVLSEIWLDYVAWKDSIYQEVKKEMREKMDVVDK